MSRTVNSFSQLNKAVFGFSDPHQSQPAKKKLVKLVAPKKVRQVITDLGIKVDKSDDMPSAVVHLGKVFPRWLKDAIVGFPKLGFKLTSYVKNDYGLYESRSLSGNGDKVYYLILWESGNVYRLTRYIRKGDVVRTEKGVVTVTRAYNHKIMGRLNGQPVRLNKSEVKL